MVKKDLLVGARVEPIAEREKAVKTAIKMAIAKAQQHNGVVLLPCRLPMRYNNRQFGQRQLQELLN